MIIVKHTDVVSRTAYGRTIRDILDHLIKPKLEEDIDLLDQSQFVAAIIEMFPEGHSKLFMNGDARFQFELFEGKLKKEDVGKTVNWDIRDVKDFTWVGSEVDPNSAKAMVIRFNEDLWILNFDFRYNKEKAKAVLGLAREYSKCVQVILDSNAEVRNPPVYLLWSAAELVWDAQLFLLAEEVRSNSHVARIDKLKIWDALRDESFASTYLFLSQNKNRARYAEQKLPKKLSKKDLESHREIIDNQIKAVSNLLNV